MSGSPLVIFEQDGSHTGEVVLFWVFKEQARHEYIPDECKSRYIIDVHPSPSLVKVRDTTVVPSELNKRGVVQRTNTGLTNTYHIAKLRKLS